jgi:hypothetical protein
MTTQQVPSRSPLLTVGAAAASAFTIALISLPREAHAFQDENPRCFATAPTWNAERGALVSASSSGPVAAVVNALGESRTHVMISNGDWATESTTRVPSIVNQSMTIGIWPFTTTITVPYAPMPLEPMELAAGSPGFSMINMGGAYAYWANAPQVFRQVPRRTLQDVLHPELCGNVCKAQGTSDWLWFEVPYETVAAPGNSIYYSLGSANGGPFVHTSYGFHQYMAGLLRGSYAFEGEATWLRGIECAQVPTYAYRKFVNAHNPNILSGSSWVYPHQYTHNETVNAGVALWYSVYNSCKAVDPGFWGKLGNSLLSLGGGADLKDTTCNHAAWQVLNCFFNGEDQTGGGCKSIDISSWNAYAPNANGAGAFSMSPDGVMGLGPRATQAVDAGPWANFVQGTLQWNQGGSTYGCFY